jgi:hypothetical protein
MPIIKRDLEKLIEFAVEFYQKENPETEAKEIFLSLYQFNEHGEEIELVKEAFVEFITETSILVKGRLNIAVENEEPEWIDDYIMFPLAIIDEVRFGA